MSNEVTRQIPRVPADDNELGTYLETCPILDAERVHMQVVIVHSFYNYPDITNEELTTLLTARFPDSNWMRDPDGRANTDRRKFNAGAFRCMGGWAPSGPEDPHYAVALNGTTPSHDEEVSGDTE